MRAERKRAFLAAFSECGNLTKAGRLAQVDRRMHYVWMKDPEYAEAFREAEEVAIENLEAEARRRAVEGLRKKKFNSKGEPIIDPETGEQYTEHDYSDTLLIFLLKGARPEKYREYRNISLTGKDGGPVQVEGIGKLSDAELDEKINSIINGIAGGTGSEDA